MTGLMPTLYLSHGSPMLPFEPIAARDFMRGLATRLPRPKAILCASAHWETETPAVGAAERPATIHDFYGFPEELYRLSYPVPGAPSVAQRVVDLLGSAGIGCALDPAQGLDHGAWNPLLLAYPQAQIPVLQLSIQHHLGTAHHVALGEALAPLRAEGVLIVGSGAATHNLRHLQAPGTPPADWARDFEAWLCAAIDADDRAGLIDYRRQAPGAALAHPRDEHLIPLYVALGAGKGEVGQAIHRSFAHGSLSMSSFGWGEVAAEAA